MASPTSRRSYPYILTASRFAHYLKVMARGEFGSLRGQ